jgi:hypothetical protein
MQHIATRIEALRKGKGISEAQLALDSAIPRVTLRRRMVAPETFTLIELHRIAAALDVTPTDLNALVEESA